VKTLKFDHESAQDVLNGKKSSTWRLYDDKDLSVNDNVRIIDKVDPGDTKTWRIVGDAKVQEIIEKKLGDVTDRDMAGHEIYSSKEAMLETYRKRYGERVTLDEPVKIVVFKFTPASGDTPTQAMLLDAAKMFTDGGSRNNPGQSACAYVICDLEDTVVEKSGYYMGIATNNQAEYLGMIKGLERCRDLGIDKVNLHSDSQLVVNQMNGFYKVKNQELAPLHEQLKQLAESFEKVTFHYIPRALNAEADREVNRILDDQERQARRK
jgi:ribonuclease HI